jgi:hypothetical protein
VDTTYWLQMIEWQSKFLTLILSFTKDPSRKTLRPLIELYGRDRDRMRVEVEILERQLKLRLATFAHSDEAAVRKVITKNEQRILAVSLHVRSGYRGIDLARFFKVPKTTAYGWIDWFKSLREGILAFMDTQAPIMAACQVPVYVGKQKGPEGDMALKGSAATVAQTAWRRGRWFVGTAFSPPELGETPLRCQAKNPDGGVLGAAAWGPKMEARGSRVAHQPGNRCGRGLSLKKETQAVLFLSLLWQP